MLWASLFVLFIVIVAMVRIIVVVSSDDEKQKLKAPFHWLMGLALVFASWTVIGWIFPSIKIDMTLDGKVEEKRKYNNQNRTEKDTVNLNLMKRKK